MLKIIDLGCSKHHRRQYTYYPPEAEWVQNILSNMQREGDFITFICNYGHTHHVSLGIQALKVA